MLKFVNRQDFGMPRLRFIYSPMQIVLHKRTPSDEGESCFARPRLHGLGRLPEQEPWVPEHSEGTHGTGYPSLRSSPTGANIERIVRPRWGRTYPF